MASSRSWSRLTALVLCMALAATVLLVPSTQAATLVTATHEVHERRDIPPAGWTRGARLDRRTVLPIRIALTQRNMDSLHEYVMQVSDPASSKYGQHWSPDRVRDTFAPSQESRDAVLHWLVASGIVKERLRLSRSDAWIEFHATVAEAEALFDTQYYKFSHPREERGGDGHAAVDAAYSLPAHIRPHVDFVTPTLHFDGARLDRQKRQHEDDEDAAQLSKRGAEIAGHHLRLGSPKHPGHPKPRPIKNTSNLANQLNQCDQYTTPGCLRALYGIPTLPSNKKLSSKKALGVVQYTPQAYVPSDMDLFFANYSKHQRQKRPKLVSIDGGVNQQKMQGSDYNAESNLDFQYAMTLANPLPVTLYQVGDIPQGASPGDFLDALDASYCTYDGGDDPELDAKYPDPLPGGYKGKKQCGGAPLTKVISTSYGTDEVLLTPFYMQRQCAEYAKLGLMGTTFLFASGDFGVAGSASNGSCVDTAAQAYNDGNSGRFVPSFPSSCPYVLSVGATQLLPGKTVQQPESASDQFPSGGGFSDVFAQPSYQNAALQSYYANNVITYSDAQYNNSRTSRGYPDVSLNGVNYIIAGLGKPRSISGTSASAPAFAAILALLNEARAAKGKSSLGFVNPALYANPSMFNDITNGTNPGCGTQGFSAVSGWDPVTGLGTPNYAKMLSYFLSR